MNKSPAVRTTFNQSTFYFTLVLIVYITDRTATDPQKTWRMGPL